MERPVVKFGSVVVVVAAADELTNDFFDHAT